MKRANGLVHFAAALIAGLFVTAGAACEREDAGVEAPVVDVDARPAVADADRTDDAQLAAQQQGQATATAVRTEREGERVRQSILYPTGERDSSVLLIEKVGPAQALLGQQYKYEIRVTNLSSAPLSGVTVREQLPGGFEVESPQVRMTMARGDETGAQPSTRPTTAPATAPAGAHAQHAAAAGNVATWQIGELAPGKTHTIPVIGYPNEVGQLATCVAVDYRPTLCATTEVINPQLRLTKKGPRQADICEPIQYVYTVANTGTGTAQNVRIEDPLPEGLSSEDGKNKVMIEIGELAAGQSKDVTVKLVPARPGEFTSRAVARSANAEAYSSQVTTRIVQPELAVHVQAPDWEYIGNRITYRVTVTNSGESPAQDTVLNVRAPSEAQFVRDPRLEGAAEGDAALAAERQPAEHESPPRGNVDAAARDGEPQRIVLGTIDPGQSKTVTINYVGTKEGNLEVTAQAVAACERADVQARDAAQTYVTTIPALVLEVIDQKDPVEVGQNTVYSIAVRNQGSGADNDVTLTATLPEGMEFVAATGASDVKAQGQSLTFAPVKTLAPGDTVAWRIEARAAQAADARFRVELSSESLTRPAVETEPTRLYQPNQPPPQAQPQADQPNDPKQQ